ncbi:MAG: CDP-diacylglycerol--serine O-phosphatidyltransferase [Bacteroidales bacterium]|nr:CDP-diacylglycerol--serine O-phosphatidyltransferase [Bacteroidales bacterium]
MSIKKHIPNTITCCNLLCGCVSILFTCKEHVLWASVMIFLAAVCDFFDGFAARTLNAKSPIGGELDSLSDVVSFGVAPSFIVAWFLSKTGVGWWVHNVNVFPMLAFILAAFAAVRLAKFNIDTRQTTSFIGLPVPAVGLFIASLPFMVFNVGSGTILYKAVVNPYFLLAITAIFSWLMISEVPFFSFKIKNLKFKENILRYFVVIFAIVAVIILKLVALPFVFLFYILLSVICYRNE